jgi:hypothetical protein
MLILLAMLACACALPAQGIALATPPPAKDEGIVYSYARDIVPASGQAELQAASQAEDTSALNIVRGVENCGEGYVVYPRVTSGKTAQAINDSIYNAVAQYAESVQVPIFTEYRVEYNHNCLLSIRMDILDLYGDNSAPLDSIYLTFDAHSGALCKLPDLLDAQDARWRGVLPDIVTEQAENRDITLLCDVLPIADDQQFYIADGCMVLVYEQYEITTYLAGRPEFKIPLAQLSAFIPEDSSLQKMIQVTDVLAQPADAAAQESMQ